MAYAPILAINDHKLMFYEKKVVARQILHLLGRPFQPLCMWLGKNLNLL